MVVEILVILGLVLVNGVLSGAEIAVVAMRKTRVEHLIAEGNRAAAAVRRLHRDPERFFATVQIGITVVGATAGAFGGSAFARDLAPILRELPGVGRYAEELAFAIVVSAISFLSLVLGELVPKSLALRGAERYALFIGRPVLALSWLARPLVWLLTASSNAVLRVFGDRTTFTETRLSPEELQQLVGEAAEAGAVDKTAGEIASRAIDFGGLTAGQVMLPLNKVAAVPRDATPEKVKQILLEQGHTRMPVFEGKRERIVGYVTVRDLLAVFWQRELVVLEDAIRPAYFVRESKAVVAVLAEMRRLRTQIAVVVDEHETPCGIVTLDDLVEELVGEFFPDQDEGAAPSMRPEADGAVVVRGDVRVRELNRALGLDLPESQDFNTIAGLCLELAGRIPAAGERFTALDGTVLEILHASNRQVHSVRVSGAGTSLANHAASPPGGRVRG